MLEWLSTKVSGTRQKAGIHLRKPWGSSGVRSCGSRVDSSVRGAYTRGHRSRRKRNNSRQTAEKIRIGTSVDTSPDSDGELVPVGVVASAVDRLPSREEPTRGSSSLSLKRKRRQLRPTCHGKVTITARTMSREDASGRCSPAHNRQNAAPCQLHDGL